MDVIKELLSTEILWSLGASTVVWVLARKLPKSKIAARLVPMAHGAGVFVSKFLMLRIGKGATDSFEEGVVVTLGDVAAKTIQAFVDGMLEDNDRRKK
jgi:hypothetical protein